MWLGVKNPPAVQEMQETWVQSLGWEDPLGEDMAIDSSILAWRIPWTEESDGLQSTGRKRVRRSWAHVCCLGAKADLSWVILFAKVVLDLISYFCIGYYFRIIPRPLSHDRKSRLKVARLIIAQPLGVALSALIFYFLPNEQNVFSCIIY